MIKKTYETDVTLTCRDISKLVPELQTLLATFFSQLATMGIHMLVIETYRTQARQDMLYQQGKSKVKRSKHQDFKAFDAIPIDSTGKILWDYPPQSWKLIGQLAEKIGLKWGGNWEKFKDNVHYEIN